MTIPTRGAVAARLAGPTARVRRAARPSWLGPVLVLLGTAALVVGGALPVWGTRLIAPQYPKGLELWFYGGRVDGPLREVNGLNHYIGMRPIDLGLVPELALWPLAVVGCTVLLLAAVLLPGRLGRLAVAGLFLVPVGVLADIQRWLIVFGTELDRESALRLDPFVPLVVGPSTVWNFTIWAYPGPALVAIWMAGGIALAARRQARPSRGRAGVLAVVALAMAVGGTLAFVIPAVRPVAEPGNGGSVVLASSGGAPTSSLDLAALVAAAPPGSTLVVPPGTYRTHLVIEQPLTLIADGAVRLDGGGRGSVVTVASADVTVRGFVISGTGGQGEEAAGVKVVRSDRVTIEANRIERAFTAISVVGGAEIRILDNEIVGAGQVTSDAAHATAPVLPAATLTPAATAQGHDHGQPADGAGPGGQGDGIALWNVLGGVVRGNEVREVRDGIYLNYAEELLVDDNRIDRSRYAVHVMFGEGLTIFGNDLRENLSGLVLMNAAGVLVGRNSLIDARSPGTGFGVVVKDVRGFTFAENLVARNRVGLQADGVTHRLHDEGLVVSNVFASNDVGVALMASTDLVFGGNVFDANLLQVRAHDAGVARRNAWTHAGVGNQWSDYAGFDLEGDGVGDVPHSASGVVDALLDADPALQAYSTSPALSVLSLARGVWEAGVTPAVVDDSPRLAQVGAAAAPDLGGAPEAAWPWLAVAAALALGAGTALLAGRRLPARRGATA